MSVFKPFENENKNCKFGDYRITAFDVPHDNCPCFGFFIRHKDEKIIYLTDAEYCGYVFKSLEPTVLMVECNFDEKYLNQDEIKYAHEIRGHLSTTTCKDFIKANDNDNLKQIILLHPSKGNLDKTEALTDIKAITDKPVCFAEKGMTISFKCKLHLTKSKKEIDYERIRSN